MTSCNYSAALSMLHRLTLAFLNLSGVGVVSFFVAKLKMVVGCRVVGLSAVDALSAVVGCRLSCCLGELLPSFDYRWVAFPPPCSGDAVPRCTLRVLYSCTPSYSSASFSVSLYHLPVPPSCELRRCRIFESLFLVATDTTKERGEKREERERGGARS